MRIDILGALIDAVDMREAERRVADLVRNGRPARVITMNPEFLYRAQRERELLAVANGADLVTADGVGIVWAARMTGSPVPERVTGIDLMLRLVERAAAEGWSIFLLGAAPGVAEEAARRLCQRFPGLKVAGTHHGYFSPAEEDAVVEEIRRSGARLVFVALGAPKQELWIWKHIGELGPVVAMGVGGSFDVIAGRVKRAPAWAQKMHLEWLVRLLRQPSRWRRMTVLPRFAWLVLKKYGCCLGRARGCS